MYLATVGSVTHESAQVAVKSEIMCVSTVVCAFEQSAASFSKVVGRNVKQTVHVEIQC